MTIDARAANESRGNCLTGFQSAGGGENEKKAALLALAERVKAATAGDGRLSVEVEIAVLGYPEKAYDRRSASWPSDRMEFARQWLGSRYTSSIDAAMTLVPEGLFARIYGEWPQAIIVRGEAGYPEVSRSCALTMPLALTSAALRARAAMMGEG
ncbi:hypothetical protein [uncultured Sphingomonas sp.]|uniref:hypothetical protein n=1 Tax=uncultured Sphingomonas sp. TaxID=158754 RepID=UPI0025F1D62F|nr:hypothetical protein [uncultured Sphingomonas sp.]